MTWRVKNNIFRSFSFMYSETNGIFLLLTTKRQNIGEELNNIKPALFCSAAYSKGTTKDLLHTVTIISRVLSYQYL